MRRLAPFTAAALLVWAGQFGCTKKKVETAPKFDPDANSGPDAKRSGAQAIEINKQYTDNVDFDKGDRTDWKSVELKGHPGDLGVELHWDNAQSDLTVSVYDGIGAEVASSPPPSGQATKKLTVPIQEVGTYFIRVQAPEAKANSDYTIETKWAGEAQPAEPPPPPVVKEEHKEHHHHVEHHKAHGGGGRPEDALQGRIVQAHAEGGGTVLYLDKGSAAGVKEGTNGWILEGPSGFNVLDGGTFTVTKVVDENRSVGKTGLKTIGRNTRIAINVGK